MERECERKRGVSGDTKIFLSEKLDRGWRGAIGRIRVSSMIMVNLTPIRYLSRDVDNVTSTRFWVTRKRFTLRV